MGRSFGARGRGGLVVALVAGLVGFGRFPARSAFGTSGLYAGARVEISCTAVTG
jgi:enamine deaminase RidA (YjgF/YER057c/UK114 family)